MKHFFNNNNDDDDFGVSKDFLSINFNKIINNNWFY